MASTFLSKTLGTPTSSRIWTFSTWIKRSGISSGQHIFSIDNGTDRDAFSFDSDDGLRLYFNSSASPYADLSTNRLLRDTSSFYHLVLTVDTTQATADDRVKLYINGTQYTWDETTIDPSQNYDTFNASGNTFRIGRDRTTTAYLDAILAHTHFIDGTAYDASTFGETDSTSGIWEAKTSPSVTYGNNGFFLKMENSGAMGTDSSGNGNNFTIVGNLTQNVDTPDNNFATINPSYYSSAQSTLSNGNLTATSSGANWNNFHSTIAPSTGKWYWEVKVVNVGSNTHPIGIVGTEASDINSTSPGDSFDSDATGISYVQTGDKDVAGSRTSYGNSYTTGDIIGVAMDLDNHKLYFSKNGTYQNSGVPTSGATGTGAISIVSGHSYLASFAHYNTMVDSVNFGQGYFGTTAVASANADGNGHGKMEYAVPTGYYTLNTKNIKEFG